MLSFCHLKISFSCRKVEFDCSHFVLLTEMQPCNKKELNWTKIIASAPSSPQWKWHLYPQSAADFFVWKLPQPVMRCWKAEAALNAPFPAGNPFGVKPCAKMLPWVWGAHIPTSALGARDCTSSEPARVKPHVETVQRGSSREAGGAGGAGAALL